MTTEKRLIVCKNGHKYYISSECPSCPDCNETPENSFLSKLSSPARNALVHEGIDSLIKLSKYTEKEILKIHGIGPASLPTLRTSLEEEELSFKNNAIMDGES